MSMSFLRQMWMEVVLTTWSERNFELLRSTSLMISASLKH